MRAASTLRTDRRLLPGYREVERREAIARERADQQVALLTSAAMLVTRPRPKVGKAGDDGPHGCLATRFTGRDGRLHWWGAADFTGRCRLVHRCSPFTRAA
jgi:hypothetical protein